MRNKFQFFHRAGGGDIFQIWRKRGGILPLGHQRKNFFKQCLLVKHVAVRPFGISEGRGSGCCNRNCGRLHRRGVHCSANCTKACHQRFMIRHKHGRKAPAGFPHLVRKRVVLQQCAGFAKQNRLIKHFGKRGNRRHVGSGQNPQRRAMAYGDIYGRKRGIKFCLHGRLRFFTRHA